MGTEQLGTEVQQCAEARVLTLGVPGVHASPYLSRETTDENVHHEHLAGRPRWTPCREIRQPKQRSTASARASRLAILAT
ncbi:hypothetical protein GCM10008955_16900 [Deinococcus malanensis]|uniref:Uncharacterized protein n=1 Tax=Deinococcus malanensis TaxID=1706855 RepID=A0ABQ2ESP9_9DEIO|nr:hypothetical protein GCM10008955_16900 [Deinococcus malanensis]